MYSTHLPSLFIHRAIQPPLTHPSAPVHTTLHAPHSYAWIRWVLIYYSQQLVCSFLFFIFFIIIIIVIMIINVFFLTTAGFFSIIILFRIQSIISISIVLWYFHFASCCVLAVGMWTIHISTVRCLYRLTIQRIEDKGGEKFTGA